MIIPLHLRQDPTADAAPRAWFLPGDSAERWLTELVASGLAEAGTRLFIVPRSVADRSPAGVLVVPATTAPRGARPAGVPCRQIAGRLFVPADAALFPPVTEAELHALCPLPVSFFHPSFGWSGFEEEAALRIWDLLESPAERGHDWNRVRPGAPALPELLGIVLAKPPSLEDLFGGAEQDIASQPPTDLPPSPDEPKDDRWSQAGRSLRRLFAQGVAGAMRQVPHTGPHRTWVNDLEDWAHRQLQGVTEQLERMRFKELHRLLRLLDTDPEAGLRHAIPMNQFAHRGLAPPSGQLGPRSTDFDPRRLGGGGPADFWAVTPDLAEQLRRRYRAMADREMQLGRHRRAAYIYAELLGDLVSAANALKQGRHFREAAWLYEEQLDNLLEAARCLAEAGLLAEAIDRFEKLGHWLEVADLQDRLGHHAAAQAAVRRVIDERLRQDDVLGAAKLLDERLHETDESLDRLLRAWPASSQAVACTAAAFRMLAKLGRHEAALRRLARFSREPQPEPLVLPLVSALVDVARDYPHASVRDRAKDFSRVLIAGQLKQPGLGEPETAQLMQCLIRLAPHDRLVSRDANRHLADRRAARGLARRVTLPPPADDKPTVEDRYDLPRQIEWLALRRERHWFYALGLTAQHLTLARDWHGEIQSVTWQCPAAVVRSAALVFEPTREEGRAVALALPGGMRLEEKRFPATDQTLKQECLAGTPAWLAGDHFPVSFGDESVWAGHVAAGRAVLACHDKRGRLQRTIDVTEDLLVGATRRETTRLCLAALARGAAMALGNRLVLTREDGGLTRLELPGQAVGLVATEAPAPPGVAVLLDHGAVMHWIGASGLLELDRDIATSNGAFMPDGPLVLIAGAWILVLTVDDRGVQKMSRLLVPGQRFVGVCATSSEGRFAVLDAQGAVTLYRLPDAPEFVGARGYLPLDWSRLPLSD